MVKVRTGILRELQADPVPDRNGRTIQTKLIIPRDSRVEQEPIGKIVRDLKADLALDLAVEVAILPALKVDQAVETLRDPEVVRVRANGLRAPS